MSHSLLPDMNPTVQESSNSALFAWLIFKSVPFAQFHARPLQTQHSGCMGQEGTVNVPDTQNQNVSSWWITKPAPRVKQICSSTILEDPHDERLGRCRGHPNSAGNLATTRSLSPYKILESGMICLSLKHWTTQLLGHPILIQLHSISHQGGNR